MTEEQAEVPSVESSQRSIDRRSINSVAEGAVTQRANNDGTQESEPNGSDILLFQDELLAWKALRGDSGKITNRPIQLDQEPQRQRQNGLKDKPCEQCHSTAKDGQQLSDRDLEFVTFYSPNTAGPEKPFVAETNHDNLKPEEATAELLMYKNNFSGPHADNKSPSSGSTMFGEDHKPKSQMEGPSPKSELTTGGTFHSHHQEQVIHVDGPGLVSGTKQSDPPGGSDRQNGNNQNHTPKSEPGPPNSGFLGYQGSNFHGQISTDSNDLSNSASPEQLLFFNFHEYSVPKYELLETKSYGEHEHPLIVTHFPNPYVDLAAPAFRNTRIVRVPKAYDLAPSNRYPQFSTLMPGFEPAALIDPTVGKPSFLNRTKSANINKFVPKGKYFNQIFGFSSISPLSNYLSAQEFEDIVKTINAYLKQGLDPLSYANVAYSVANFITIWVLDEIVRSPSKKSLDQLEEYVETLNNNTLKLKNIKIISPRKTGYICLDFEIPKPKA